MTHWFDVFRYEIRQQFRRKSFLFLTFGVPLLAIAGFFAYQMYQDATRDEDDAVATPVSETFEESSRVVGLVDQTPEGLFPPPEAYARADLNCAPPTDPSQLTPDVIKRITSPGCAAGAIRGYDSLETGKAALDAGEIDVLYVVEEDYVASGTVSTYAEGFSLDLVSSDQVVVESYILTSLLRNADPEVYERLLLRLQNPANIGEHRLDAGAQTRAENEDQGFVLVYAFGIILMMAIFWGGGYVMQSIVQEKESRIIEIMLSSVRPLPLLVGKVLAMGTLSLLQVVLLLGTFLYLGGQAETVIEGLGNLEVEPYIVILMVVYFVLGYLLYGSLMAGIGALSTTARESQNFVSIVTLPAVVPFFFLSIFVEEPNGTLATLFSLVPLTAPLSMGMRMSIVDVPADQLALSIGLLAVAVAFALWFAARLFRVNTLLMGSMPRFKDIPKLLRG